VTIVERAFVKAGFKPLKPKKARNPKDIKCRKCGTTMERVENTNVVICPGEIEIKGTDGEIRTAPCNNRIIFTN